MSGSVTGCGIPTCRHGPVPVSRSAVGRRNYSAAELRESAGRVFHTSDRRKPIFHAELVFFTYGKMG